MYQRHSGMGSPSGAWMIRKAGSLRRRSCRTPRCCSIRTLQKNQLILVIYKALRKAGSSLTLVALTSAPLGRRLVLRRVRDDADEQNEPCLPFTQDIDKGMIKGDRWI